MKAESKNEMSFHKPQGVVVDVNGNIIVADSGNHCIRLIDTRGHVSTLAGDTRAGYRNGVAEEALFDCPTGVTVDGKGNILVADSNNHAIRKVDVNGLVSTVCGGRRFGFRNGTLSEASFLLPSSVAMMRDGSVLVVDSGNHCIRHISGEEVSIFAGGKAGFRDGVHTEACFYTPTYVCVDKFDTVYVADSGNHRIRKITPDGLVSTVAGSWKVCKEKVNGEDSDCCADGIVVDNEGNIVQADSVNGCIRVIPPNGLCSMLVELIQQEEKKVEQQQYHTPWSVAFDKEGNILLADSRANCVRQITKLGVESRIYPSFSVTVETPQNIDIEQKALVEEHPRQEEKKTQSQEAEEEGLVVISDGRENHHNAAIAKQQEELRLQLLNLTKEIEVLKLERRDVADRPQVQTQLSDEAKLVEQEWERLSASVSDVGGCSLEDFRCLTLDELNEFVKTVSGVKKGAFRRLYGSSRSTVEGIEVSEARENNKRNSDEQSEKSRSQSVECAMATPDIVEQKLSIELDMLPLTQEEPMMNMIKALDGASTSAVVHNLEAAARGATVPAMRVMANDIITIVSKYNMCDCQSSTALFRTFVQMYQGMLTQAESAYRMLQHAAVNHQQGRFEAAKSLFAAAKSDCLRVATVIQHIIDCKFDVSLFKCNDERCTKTAHTCARINLDMIPDYVEGKESVMNDVPDEYIDRQWNEALHFQKWPFDRTSTSLHSHLDYVCAKAQAHDNGFHAYLEGTFQGLGDYQRGPLKAKLRCAAKVEKDYANKTTEFPRKPASMYLKDALRGTLVCAHVGHIQTALSRLESISGIKDRLQVSSIHDVLVNIQHGGLVCEVQFHLADFYNLKKFSHGPYEVSRAVDYTELIGEDGKLILKPFELRDQ